MHAWPAHKVHACCTQPLQFPDSESWISFCMANTMLKEAASFPWAWHWALTGASAVNMWDCCIAVTSKAMTWQRPAPRQLMKFQNMRLGVQPFNQISSHKLIFLATRQCKQPPFEFPHTPATAWCSHVYTLYKQNVSCVQTWMSLHMATFSPVNILAAMLGICIILISIFYPYSIQSLHTCCVFILIRITCSTQRKGFSACCLAVWIQVSWGFPGFSRARNWAWVPGFTWRKQMSIATQCCCTYLSSNHSSHWTLLAQRTWLQHCSLNQSRPSRVGLNVKFKQHNHTWFVSEPGCDL